MHEWCYHIQEQVKFFQLLNCDQQIVNAFLWKLEAFLTGHPEKLLIRNSHHRETDVNVHQL